MINFNKQNLPFFKFKSGPLFSKNFGSLKYLSLLAMLLMLGVNGVMGQTSTQNFGTTTGSNTSQTASTSLIANPTSGTTYARAGATPPSAPVVLATASNPLGTTGAYARCVASTSTSVTKMSPWVGYTGGTEFYTSFKVLFGDASAGSTATSGTWCFYQGNGTMYSNNGDFSGGEIFTGLIFTYGAGGAISLTYRASGANTTTGLTTTSFSSGTVYTIEIIGNNKSSGTISYSYMGSAKTVAVQKFDLYVNGTLIGDDLLRAQLSANTVINSGTFIGINSTSNAANIFVDDAVVYNAVPATIGSSASNPSLAVTGTTAHGSVCTSSPATTQTYTITNTGTAAADVVVSSSDAQFVVSNLSSTSIGATNGTSTYDVTFTPTTSGAKTATITVYYNTSTSATTSSLTGTGSTPVTQAVTTSAASSVTAQSATLNGNYTNAGVCPATTEKGFVYSLTSDDADPIVGDLGVTKTTVTLGSTGAYTLALTSLPSSSGYSYKAYVYNGTTYTYGTVQTFTTSDALAISGTLSNGSVCPNVPATAVTYTVTNNGATSVSGVAVSSSDAQFVVSSISSSTIAAAGTATYTVTFTPSSTGSKSTTVTVSGTSVTSVTNIPTGTGTTPVTAAVTSSAANSVLATTATLNGNVTTLGVCPNTTQKGFVYSLTSTSATPLNGDAGVTTTVVASLVSGAYTLSLTGLTQGTSYSFRAYVYDGTTYTYGTVQTFTTLTPPANDDCNNASTLTVGASATSGTNVGATKSNPTTFTVFSNYTSTVTNPDVWYSFTPTCSGSHTITVTPTGFDLVMAVFTGGTCPDPTYTAYKDAGASGVAETHTFTVTAGTTYRVMVFGYNGATGTFTIGVSTAVNSTLTLANTSTPATGNIASGTNNATLFGFGLTPSACNNIDISSVSISTTGTAISSDISNFRLLYDANSNGTADASEISSPIGTVASLSNPLVFSGLTGQAFTASTVRRYLLIADVASSLSGGATFTASLANANVTSTASVSGSASGNTQTIAVPTVTIANTGTPATGSIAIAATNQIFFGFALTPNTSVDLTSVNIQTTGTATSSDVSNFRLVYDANSDGAASAGEISSALGTVSTLSTTLSFSGISGQTGFSSVRRYLLIADVSSNATFSRTFTGSMSNTDVTTSATSNTGSAIGNTMTIIRLVTAGDIAIIGYGSDTPDKFAFLVVNDIPANTVLYFTDNGWTGSSLNSTEGTITWTSPNSILPAGTVVTCSSVTSPTFSSGTGTLTNSVALASGGDQIICYRGTAVGTATEFIAGFSASQWITTGIINNGTSYLPTGLVAGVTASNVTSLFDNMYYNGVLTGPSLFLRAMVNSSTNWLGSTNIQTFPSFTTSLTNSASLTGNTTIVNLILNSGENVSIGANTLTIQGTVSGSGTLIGSSSSNLSIGGSGTFGTINFDQTTDGTTNVLNSITLNRTGVTATLGNKLIITNAFTPTAGILATGDFLTLRSVATGTASIARGSSSGGYVTGNVTVERYIPAKRAWRFLTTPLIGSSNNSIFYNWQNNGSAVANYGVELWSPLGTSAPSSSNSGLAYYFGGTSIKEYTNNAWSSLTNTNTSNLFDGNTNNAYSVFVTGPFTIDGSGNINTGSSATTLSATGTLIQGTHTKSLGTATAGQYFLVGNPYASALDPKSISLTNIANNFYMWDPNCAGTYNSGQYTTYNRTANTYALVGSGSGSVYTSGSSNVSTDNTAIQSGQAFFVQASAAGTTSLTFSESNKVSGSSNVFRTTSTDVQTLRHTLKKSINGVVTNIDGALGIFYNGGNAAVDFNDAAKFSNSTENIVLRRANGSFAIEERPLVTENDTLFVRLTNTNQSAYTLELTGENFTNTPGLTATLKDAYTNTNLPLSITDTNRYNFAVDANAASTGDRFMIVFKANTTLPVQFTHINATQKGASVQVDWKVATEQNIKQYVVEKSTNGINFVAIATQAANNIDNSSYTAIDNSPITGSNYYRILSTDNNGKQQYSNVAVVKIGGKQSSISVYPNPVINNTMNLQLENIAKGNYTIQLVNTQGSVVMQTKLQHAGGSGTQSIDLPNTLSSGNYVLKATADNGVVFTEKVVLSSKF